jgi:hypothetical protein
MHQSTPLNPIQYIFVVHVPSALKRSKLFLPLLQTFSSASQTHSTLDPSFRLMALTSSMASVEQKLVMAVATLRAVRTERVGDQLARTVGSERPALKAMQRSGEGAE